jgi:hypothetical protein
MLPRMVREIQSGRHERVHAESRRDSSVLPLFGDPRRHFQPCSAVGASKQSSSLRFVNSSQSTPTSIRALTFPRWIAPSGLLFSESGPGGDLLSSLSDLRPWSDGIERAFDATGGRSRREGPGGLPFRQSFWILFIASRARTRGVRGESRQNSRSWDSPSASRPCPATSPEEMEAMTSGSDGPPSFETISTSSRPWTSWSFLRSASRCSSSSS